MPAKTGKDSQNQFSVDRFCSSYAAIAFVIASAMALIWSDVKPSPEKLVRQCRKEVRRTEDYRFNTVEEMTEEELEAVPEAERKLIRYFIEHNPEKKVIEIRPGNDNVITLHGAQDVENFIEAIRDYSRKVF